MIHRYLVTILLLTGLMMACNMNQRKLNLIDGTWEGVLLTEQGDSLPIDPRELGFTFDQERETYTFNSTLNRKEAGTFYIQTKYLFTKDTLDANSLEKSVEILQLTEDSLRIKMMEKGRERQMNLVKTKE